MSILKRKKERKLEEKRKRESTNLVLAVKIAQTIKILRMTLSVHFVLGVHLLEISFVRLWSYLLKEAFSALKAAIAMQMDAEIKWFGEFLFKNPQNWTPNPSTQVHSHLQIAYLYVRIWSAEPWSIIADEICQEKALSAKSDHSKRPLNNLFISSPDSRAEWSTWKLLWCCPGQWMC